MDPLTRLARLSPKESQVSLSLNPFPKSTSTHPSNIALGSEEGIQSGRITPQRPRPKWDLGRAAGDDDRHQGRPAKETESTPSCITLTQVPNR